MLSAQVKGLFDSQAPVCPVCQTLLRPGEFQEHMEQELAKVAQLQISQDWQTEEEKTGGMPGAGLGFGVSRECQDSDAELDVDGDDTLEYGRAQVTENSALTTLDVVKARIRDLEKQLSKGDRFKCLICMGAKKLCPQCNTITSPGDLRRVYL
ncbi:hypothetical protein NHX12_033297 [Muraenolepis orangiensis]|uniref:E3 ubiquitin-protein ligase RNF220 middle domain-containing protein n=1 Tax=Muraenolepis orangiensis TaxID=630683 RepID=A0A9Q0IHU8_9TELE|nr:hypothetical protein NHX12_033297 [Muraenolepis orangiensis]